MNSLFSFSHTLNSLYISVCILIYTVKNNCTIVCSLFWKNGVCGCVLTCLGLRRTSWVVAVARMALLLPGLSCRLIDKPLTSCTPNSAMVTFSSTTVTVFSARIKSDKGDSTYGTEQERKRRADETLRDLRIPFEQAITCDMLVRTIMAVLFHDSDATYCIGLLMETFFISCQLNPMRNQQPQQQPPAKL